MVPPAGSVRMPSVAPSRSIASKISGSVGGRRRAAAAADRVDDQRAVAGSADRQRVGGGVRGLRLDLAALEDRGGDRVAAARLGDVDLRPRGLGEADHLELVQPLVDARGERAAGGRDDQVVGRVPAELLDHLEGHRLRPLGVERAQGDVGELDPARQRELAAGAVGLVVVAVELADLGAEGATGFRLPLLHVAGVEDVGGGAGLGGQRRDRGADVAGRDAADLVLAQLQQAGDRHADDAVLVGERRAVGRVVLQVEVLQPELGAEPIGLDQRRLAGELADPRLGVRRCDRQQLLEAPDVPGAALEPALGDRLGGALVVVVDVEALAAGRALEGPVQQRGAVATVTADEFRRAGTGSTADRPPQMLRVVAHRLPPWLPPKRLDLARDRSCTRVVRL